MRFCLVFLFVIKFDQGDINMINFGQVLTAMITPFKEDGSVNYQRVEILANYLADNGSDGIVVHGTTGESPTLTHQEEYELYRVVKNAVGKRVAVIAGTGSNSTAETLDSTQVAEKLGVDGAMVVVPYYNKPSQEGMYQHFKKVAESTSLPILIYNIQGRTGVNMTAETVERLAKEKNIVGIKEASGLMDQVSEIHKRTQKHFMIYSGDDDKTLEVMKRGGIGVISVASHIIGKEIKKMCQAFAAGNVAEAEKLNAKYSPLFKVLFITSNPAPVKAALAMIGHPVGGLRLPLVEVNASEREQIRKVLADLDLVKK
jgi:4-hydroxy-tetrahydrodipicolinate synthase